MGNKGDKPGAVEEPSTPSSRVLQAATGETPTKRRKLTEAEYTVSTLNEQEARKMILFNAFKLARERLQPYLKFASAVTSYLPDGYPMRNIVFTDKRVLGTIDTMMSDSEPDIVQNITYRIQNEMTGDATRRLTRAQSAEAEQRKQENTVALVKLYETITRLLEEMKAMRQFDEKLIVEVGQSMTKQIEQLKGSTSPTTSQPGSPHDPRAPTPPKSSDVTPPTIETSSQRTSTGDPVNIGGRARPRRLQFAQLPEQPDLFNWPPSRSGEPHVMNPVFAPENALRPQFLNRVRMYINSMNQQIHKNVTFEDVIQSGNEQAIAMLAKLIGISMRHFNRAQPTQYQLLEYMNEAAEPYQWFATNYPMCIGSGPAANLTVSQYAQYGNAPGPAPAKEPIQSPPVPLGAAEMAFYESEMYALQGEMGAAAANSLSAYVGAYTKHKIH